MNYSPFGHLLEGKKKKKKKGYKFMKLNPQRINVSQVNYT